MGKIVAQGFMVGMKYTLRCCAPAQKGRFGRVTGFTLVELIVVITIMVVMLALAANMLRGGARGQGLQSAVEMVDSMVREARLDAIGKGTWSRLVIIHNPDDPSRNMRTMGVMSKDPQSGKWRLVNRLQTLPPGFYISPQYSTPLEAAKSASGKGKKTSFRPFTHRDGQDTMSFPGNRQMDVYFIEFDAEGRMTQPNMASRLVVVAGAMEGEDERPTPMTDGKPGMAGGIVIYPKGHVSRLRTQEQIVPN